MYIMCCKNVKPKERLHIISLGPIGESLTSKSVHELSTKSVRIDVIDTFWKATKGELWGIV